MKGRSLNQQECLQLNQGNKVYVEANNIFSSIENGVYIKLKGTCFTNIKKEINVSRFSVTSFNYVNGYIKTFEYEEEKEMKEYTFKEVIARIEDGQEYKCTVDYANIKSIFKDDDGDITFNFANEKSERIVIDPKFKFILVQKPVKFLEAVEAKKEGKTVYCVLNSKKFTYEEHDLVDQYDKPISADEILLGEWCIENE